MGKKYFLSSEGAQQFSDALDLLNQSINEFNQVADKMIPERLLTDGLLVYLKDFCKILEEDSNIRVTFNSKEEQLKVGEEMEIDLFRVVRALLLMLMRNSQSTLISLNFIKKPKLILFSIQDNGVNIFRHDSFIVRQGIENVKVILATIGGTLDIRNYQGNNIEIEVPVNF